MTDGADFSMMPFSIVGIDRIPQGYGGRASGAVAIVAVAPFCFAPESTVACGSAVAVGVVCGICD